MVLLWVLLISLPSMSMLVLLLLVLLLPSCLLLLVLMPPPLELAVGVLAD